MKRKIVAVLLAVLCCSHLAAEDKGMTFRQNDYTFRVMEGNKVALVEIPKKFKSTKLSNCLVDLTETIKHKKQYYELVSVADSVFVDIFKGNYMVLQIPPTVTHIGLGNQINDLYYNYTNYNNWLDVDRTILLNRTGDSIVWVNTLKSHKFTHMPLIETVKVFPVWFWSCFPKLQSITLPEGLDDAGKQQLFSGQTPYMRGNNLFLIKSNKTGEVIWKSALCKHVSILDYPRTWDAEHQAVIREYFPGLEICLVEGCEYPCIVMNGIPYNSTTGVPAIESPISTSRELTNDTLSVSANQISLMTSGFVAAQAPKHINIINNTKGDVRLSDRGTIEYISQLVNTMKATTSLSRVNRCYIGEEPTPYSNIGGNLYNSTIDNLIVLNKQDTIEIWMNDKNREEEHAFIEKLVTMQAVNHIKYVLNEDEASPIELQDIERIRAKGISVSPSKISKVVEVPPRFPGGMSECMKFLQRNVRYPKICQDQGIQGRVVVQFVVDVNGDVINPEVVKKVNPHLDREALRVISSMPSWEPGMQRGKAVRVRFSMPVTFRLSK